MLPVTEQLLQHRRAFADSNGKCHILQDMLSKVDLVIACLTVELSERRRELSSQSQEELS